MAVETFGVVDVEEPKYEVILNRDHYEIRRYGKRFAIEAEMDPSGAHREGTPSGTRSPFMKLAGYIGVGSAPQNEGENKIAMTAPVTMKKPEEVKGQAIAMTAPVTMGNDSASGKRVMQFILPSAMDDLSKIPKPTNSDVTVREVPPAVGAALRYSGSFNDETNKAKAKELLKQLQDDGLDVDEELFMDRYQVMGYNPPWTIPMLRRNEIWIELTDEQVEKLKNKPAEPNA